MQLPIVTARLRLREYEKLDFAAVHNFARRMDVVQYETWGPNSEADTRRFIANNIAEQKRPGRNSFELAVTLRSTGTLIGGCALFSITPDGCAEIGFTLHPDWWRQGYATEAAHALVLAARTHLRVNRFFARCDADNAASANVLRKLSMHVVQRVVTSVRGTPRGFLVFSTNAEAG